MDIFLIFAQNIDCGYTLANLTSTHNLCFGAKIRKMGIPLQTPVCYIKVGFKGVFIARTFFPDVCLPVKQQSKIYPEHIFNLAIILLFNRGLY